MSPFSFYFTLVQAVRTYSLNAWFKLDSLHIAFDSFVSVPFFCFSFVLLFQCTAHAQVLLCSAWLHHILPVSLYWNNYEYHFNTICENFGEKREKKPTTKNADTNTATRSVYDLCTNVKIGNFAISSQTSM